MSHFPVTNSNLSATHLTVFLKEKYNLEAEVQCRFIRAGINDTYLVEDGHSKFVFRIYSFQWRSEQEIFEEIRLLNQLKENAISVSYPIADKQNNYIQKLPAPEGERFAVLFSYAPGEKLHMVSEGIHFKIGQLMARFHSVTNNQQIDRIAYTPQVILFDSLEKLSPFLDKNSAEMNFMKSTQEILMREFSNADLTQIRTGIIHLDIWFDNMNITDDQKITIFDFDFCGNGWLCLDIAYYILQIHNIERYEKAAYQPKVDSFLAGYESILKISDEEKRLIPAIGVSLYYFYLGIQCQRFDNWSNSFLNENYLKRFINGLVKKYFEIYNPG